MNKLAKLVLLVAIGETRVAKDGRSFYTAEFRDPSNPFAATVKRNFWQQKNAAGDPIWKGASPETVKPFIGKTIPGEIKTAKVEGYEIERQGKDPYTATTYTTVLLGHELPEVVFAQLGHPMVKEQAEEVNTNEPELEVA